MELSLFKNIYQGKKVLITGNTGFKGSWLTLFLNSLGAKVIGYSDEILTTPSFYKAGGFEDIIEQHWGDIRDYDSLKSVVLKSRPEFIFHLAAQALVKESMLNPLETFQVNGIGTANLLDTLKDIDFSCQVVFITSDKCYENVEWVWGYKETDQLGGKDPYSASKAVAEIVFHAYHHSFFKDEDSNVKLATARAGNVIGGGDWAKDRLIPDCIKRWSNNELVSIRRPNATRPWQHVLEPLGGYLLLGAKLFVEAKKVHGESYNFGPPSNQNFSVGEIIQDLAKYWTHSPAKELINIQEDYSFYEAGLLKLNTDKALFDIKWQPILNYAETMKLTGEWYDYFYGDVNDEKALRAFSEKQLNHYINTALKKDIKWMV